MPIPDGRSMTSSPRIDGVAKVTGQADYTADVVPAGVLYAVLVQAAVASARIQQIDMQAARESAGVAGVWTHENMPRLQKVSAFPLGAAAQKRPPMQDKRVRYDGDPIALVVADSFENARAAAHLIHPIYRLASGSAVDFATAPVQRIASLGLMQRLLSEDTQRGDPDAAIASAPLVLNHEYSSPRHLNMPMEPHATVAWWDEDSNLSVREGTQWVDGAQDVFAKWFAIKRNKVRLLSTFVGGGFGLRISMLPHAALAAMAARELQRPVKLVLDRVHICRLSAGRPATRQHVRLGATADGRLTAMLHDTVNETGRQAVYNEAGSRASKSTYAVENYRAEHSVAQLDIPPPTWMRAPGETPGSFAIESAMDELAHAVCVDPIELRIRNHAPMDPASGKPWSSNHLLRAYTMGADSFGWDRRAMEPRSRREGHLLIGMGMAAATFSAKIAPSEARLELGSDGRIRLLSRGVDIGTGAYTAMALIVAQTLGVPLDRVDVRLGDTQHARSALAGGSMMTASLGTAVHGAALKLASTLVKLARKHASSLSLVRGDESLAVRDGQIRSDIAPTASVSFAQVLAAAKRESLTVDYRTHPTFTSRVIGAKAFTSMAAIDTGSAGDSITHSWGAQFAEVEVDEALGTVRVRRMLGVFDAGRIVNALTARSQLLGGMTMGLGAALSEGVHVDTRIGRPMNANLGEYLVPVHADLPIMDVIFVGEFDAAAGPLGVKPIGELGITGSIAAIANAIYNATGRRLRELPLDLHSTEASSNVAHLKIAKV